jgi:hypothetical protein
LDRLLLTFRQDLQDWNPRSKAQSAGDNAWMLTSSALVLMMTGPGATFLASYHVSRIVSCSTRGAFADVRFRMMPSPPGKFVPGIIAVQISRLS